MGPTYHVDVLRQYLMIILILFDHFNGLTHGMANLDYGSKLWGLFKLNKSSMCK